MAEKRTRVFRMGRTLVSFIFMRRRRAGELAAGYPARVGRENLCPGEIEKGEKHL